MGRIILADEFAKIRQEFKNSGKKVVFTNGCFDILHKGHVDYMNEAKNLGDILFVGLNSDQSVRSIKGDKRPIVPENERAYILSNLNAVDFVCLFNEDTPLKLIEKVIPDFLVKGADWSIENVVGREVVEANGGQVKTIELTPGRSTTNIIKKILEVYK